MMRFASITDCGNREVNEDSIGTAQNNGLNLFVVCDGLGGHGKGDLASSLVRDVFVNQFEKCDNPDCFLGETFMMAQDLLMCEQISLHAKRQMKTTCVAMLADKKTVRIGHIGDSRLYIFKGNKVKRRTLDHSIPQMLVLSRRLKESEIRNHPERSTVMRVMGVEWEQPQYELMELIPTRKCKAFLLCTDGFWELIEDDEMCSCLKVSKDPQDWLNRMTDIVKARGVGRNMDNYSAIAVWKK